MESLCYTTNEKIINFYSEHPNIDFEEINLIVVNLLEKFICHTSNVHDNNILLDVIKNQSLEINKIFSNMNEFKGIINNLENKIGCIKGEYIDNMKVLLNTHGIESNDKFRNIFEKETDNLISKTKNIVNDSIPLSIELVSNKFSDNIKSCLQSRDGVELNKSTNDSCNLILGVVNKLVDDNIDNKKMILNLTDEFSSYTNKLKGSTTKGKLGEQKMDILLNRIFPSDTVKNCTSTPHSGDFYINRGDQVNIMFETKEYSTNVPNDEVLKFIKDSETYSESCAIFISQQSGICNKPDYWVDIHKGSVLMYLHNVNYDSDKIKTAVLMIDMIYNNISKQVNNNNIIDMNDLEEIYKEFTNFINKRDELVKILQQQCKEQINLIKSMQFNTLQTIISKHFSQPGISTFCCNNCGKIFKTSKGLANHQRVCN